MEVSRTLTQQDSSIEPGTLVPQPPKNLKHIGDVNIAGTYPWRCATTDLNRLNSVVHARKFTVLFVLLFLVFVACSPLLVDIRSQLCHNISKTAHGFGAYFDPSDLVVPHGTPRLLSNWEQLGNNMKKGYRSGLTREELLAL
jgi:hypothetical protein